MGLALLRAGEEAGLGAFLASRGARSHLVADPAVRAALPADPAGAFTASATLAGVPPEARTVFIDDDDEVGRLAEARARFPAVRVLGLRHQVLPMLVTDASPSKDVPAHFRIDAVRRYAIVGPARSGSTLLCRLLRMAGAGNPREHLRSPLAAALASPGVDRAEVWRQVAGRAASANVFGTKIVAQFLCEAAGAQSPAARLAELDALGLRFVHLRRPVLETTVSRHLSNHTRQWHAQGVLTPEQRARFEAVPYDFDALLALLRTNQHENAALEAAVAGLPGEHVLTLDYAELDADPRAAMLRVAAHVGARVDLRGVRAEKLPLKLSAIVSRNAEVRERFRSELQARGLASVLG